MVPTACTKYILRVTEVTGSQAQKTELLSYIHIYTAQLSNRGTFILGQNNKEGLNSL